MGGSETPLQRYAKALNALGGDFVAPDLASCDGKIDWAEKHLQTLRDEIGPLEAANSHTIEIEHDAQASQYVFKVQGIAEPKSDWGYIGGDCIHNLRSALDHLAFELAVLGQGRALTEKEARAPEFPIHTHPDQFEGAGKGRIGLLRPGEQTRIRELQPFNGRDLSIWGPTPGTGVPARVHPAQVPILLVQLHDLDVADKHRTVNPTWGAAAWYKSEFPAGSPFDQFDITGEAVKNGIGSWHYSGAVPEPPSEMDVKSRYPVVVGIGQPPFTYGALDQLTWFVIAVRAVVEFFRPCVYDGSPALAVRDIDPVPMFPGP